MFLSKLGYSELVQRIFEKMTFFLVDPLIDLVLDEIILHLNVLSPLRAARPPIGLEQNSTNVVLVEQGWFHIIPLFYHKIASPEDISQ